jgi:hypothetical protein
MNHTNKKWNLFVDACCMYIKDKRMKYVETLETDQNRIHQLTNRMLGIQTSVAKGLYLSGLRVMMDVQVGKLSEGSGDKILGDQVGPFLNSLVESSEKLPIFVYFVQAVTEKYGNLKGVAKEKKITSIDTFIQKFMFDGSQETGENIKYSPENYTEYLEVRNRIFYTLSNCENTDRILKLLQDTLPLLDTVQANDLTKVTI